MRSKLAQFGRGPAPLYFYYGWVQMWMLTLTQPVSWGILYYTYSVMLQPMRDATGWSLAALNGAFSIALLISGLVGPFAGRWLDTHGPRTMMTLGAIAASALVIGWSQVESLTGFYLVWAGIGVVMALVLYEPAMWVAANWFRTQRARALTLLTFGGGLASTIFIPTATALNAALGWRDALLWLGLALGAVTILPHALILRRRPADIGLQVDGQTSAPTTADQPRPATLTGHTTAQAVRERTFWLLAISFSTSGAVWVAMSVHLLSYALQRGASAGFVAAALGMIGVMQVVGRLGFAAFEKHFSLKTLSIALYSLSALALLGMLMLPPTVALVLYVPLWGISWGIVTPLRALIIASTFGNRHYGEISGTLTLIGSILRGLAPVLAGVMIAAIGYTGSFWVFLGMYLIAVLALLPARFSRPDPL
jgi:MFS family permease